MNSLPPARPGHPPLDPREPFRRKPAEWFLNLARERTDLWFERLDLRNFELPFFDGVASNFWMPSKDPKAIRWQEAQAGFDGLVVVTPNTTFGSGGGLRG